jgi:hypothetical protein
MIDSDEWDDEAWAYKKVPEMKIDYEWNYDKGDYDEVERPNMEWKLQNPEHDAHYTAIKQKIDDREAMEDWKAKRAPPNEYRAAIDKLEKDGFNNLILQPYEEGDFWAMRVELPDDFPHMNNEEGKKRQRLSTPYHISFTKPDHLDKKEQQQPGYKAALKQDLYKFYEDFGFERYDTSKPLWWSHSDTNPIEGRFLSMTHGKKSRSFPTGIKVGRGSSVGMHDYEDEFVRRGNELQERGTGKKDAFHMSID